MAVMFCRKMQVLCLLTLALVSWGTGRVQGYETKSWYSKDQYRGLYTIQKSDADVWEMQFDLIPLVNRFEGIFGVTDGRDEVSGYDDLPIQIRLTKKGYFVVKDADQFTALEYLPYRANIKYHFRMRIDLVTREYSVYIRPEQGKEILLAVNFKFNQYAKGIEHIGQVMLNSEQMNQFKVENITLQSLQKWGPWRSTKDFSGIYEWDQSYEGSVILEYDITPYQPDTHGVVGVIDPTVLVDNWSDLAIHLRVNRDGYFDVFDGEIYSATNFLPYRVNQRYHVKMMINQIERLYSISITPEKGREVLLAVNYKFRQGAIIPGKLGGICLKSDRPQELLVENLLVYPMRELECIDVSSTQDQLISLTKLLRHDQRVIAVHDFTSRAIQDAIELAEDGDMVFLPAGEYLITEPIEITKSITLRGAAQLLTVGEVEWKKYKVLPYWDDEPTRLYYGPNLGFEMLIIRGNHVRIENISFQGGAGNPGGWKGKLNQGINLVIGCAEIQGCEFFKFRMAIKLEQINVQRNLKITDSYFWKNVHQDGGYGIYATSSGQGMIQVQGNEFWDNGISIVNHSSNVDMLIDSNYFHQNDEKHLAYQIISDGIGETQSQLVVRNNTFFVNAPIWFLTGSGEVTGNYFGRMDYHDFVPILIGGLDGTEESIPHNIYVGRNQNLTGRRSLLPAEPQLWEISLLGGSRTPGYNLYENGVLWGTVERNEEVESVGQLPMIGEMFITQPDASTPIQMIDRGQWYDLHIIAVDPQGPEEIAKVEVQFHERELGELVGKQESIFRSSGNYFIETNGQDVRLRCIEGSSQWQKLAQVTENQYVQRLDGASAGVWVQPYGTHGLRYRMRFKLLKDALPGIWVLHGYVQDRDGNGLSDEEDEIGWEIQVR